MLLHIYVFFRIDSLCRDRVNRKLLIGVGVALWLIFFFGRIYGGNDLGLLSQILEVAGMHWMGSVFLIALGLFIADIASGFGFLFPGSAMRFRTFGLGIGTAFVLIAHVQGLRPPIVETREAVISGLSADLDGTTIAVMTDLHAGEMMIGPVWLNARIDQVQALQPDCIVLVGDLFERGCDPGEMIPVMRRLSAPLGVWAVRGNHDSQRPGRRDVTGEILAGAGIRLLRNESVRIDGHFVLAGIDDLTASRRRQGEGEANLERALAARPSGPTLFLSHTPWMADRAAAAGVDLMLSGHTHDGQIWPFHYLVRTRYPFICGSYDIGGMALIVSRGTGTWGPRMRLWKPGEISLITLRSSHPPFPLTR